MSIPGLLTITIANETLTYNGQPYVNTSNSAYISIGTSIPHQVLILRGYTVVCNAYAPTTANDFTIYVDLPFLGGATLKDELNYMNRLPLPLSTGFTTGNPNVVTGITQYEEMTIPLQLLQDIQPSFTAKVYNRDGTLVNTSQILSVKLLFSYGFSNLQ